MNTLAMITRRRAMQGVAATAVTAGLAGLAGAQPEAGRTKPTLHVYPDYRWLRGFSVVPSWGARIEEAWWAYDGARMREEVALAKQVHANCIRLWIEFTAWMADPDRVTAHFLDAVKAVNEAGLKTMPCLFNRWHDQTWDYGGTYAEDLFRPLKPRLDYVRALVTPLIKDGSVLLWDLCNEPQAHDLKSDVNRREFAWLGEIAATVRACGAQQPITIGTMNGGNIDTFAPLMDVLCAHPYAHTRPELEQLIGGYKTVQAKHQKPMLVNETIPGALDDAVRGEVTRFYTELLAAAGFGWMGWALREGKAISTRRDRHDNNGINGLGFHPFFTKSGELRNGLEFLTVPPQVRPPWQKVERK